MAKKRKKKPVDPVTARMRHERWKKARKEERKERTKITKQLSSPEFIEKTLRQSAISKGRIDAGEAFRSQKPPVAFRAKRKPETR